LAGSTFERIPRPVFVDECRGKRSVNFYYQHSLSIAAIISDSDPLKTLVRVILALVIAGVYLIYHPVMLMVLGLLTVFFVYWFKLRKRYFQYDLITITGF